MINYAAELNPEQLQVVQNGDGPCLVLAGAGSGKTRVITYRVTYLLEKGINPNNILLVTFTNKAAAEINKRIATLTGLPHLPWSGTFHHVAYRVLKIYAPLLGYKNNFSVLDTDDSESIIKMSLKNIKTAEKKFPSAKVLLSIISFSKNAEILIDDVLETKYPSWWNMADDIKKVASEYEVRKKQANAMDFDDLLINFSVLLNNPDARQKYAEQFHYILVDEYQDTNKIQASILKKLSFIHKNILAVGDDAQSIYSFRAAEIKNILHFDESYSNAKIFKLETNYRSVDPILELANDVIANNKKQYHKKLHSFLGKGELPVIHPHFDQTSEAQYVVQKIQEALAAGTPASEIAVLFRASHHSQMLELELTKAGINYDYRGGVRFFERAHIKDVLSYLRIINNKDDAAAWLRVLLHEEGIGPAAAQKIITAVRDVDSIQNIAALGGQILGGKALQGWKNFTEIFHKISGEKTAASIIQALLNSVYRDYLESEHVDSKDRIEDIKQLAIFAERFTDLATFLAESSLQESFALKNTVSEPKTPHTDRVVLSTIHQAKGLEWKIVFLINLCSGAFPSERALKEPQGIEEERRLFYVAITRAKQQLYLTYPMAGGNFGDMLCVPSVFLDQIKPGLCTDNSLLSFNSTIFNDPDSDITYVPEDKPLKIKPGSFLRSLDDL